MTKGKHLIVKLVVVAALVSAVMVAAVGAQANEPRAHAAGTCGVGNGRHLGYSYVTSLWVYHTSCGTGKKLASHRGHLRGWRCSKKILATSPVQYDARETCHSGGREVQYSFTQNT